MTPTPAGLTVLLRGGFYSSGPNGPIPNTGDSGLRAGAPEADDPQVQQNLQELQKAAESFEALFVAQLLQAMRETPQADGILDGGTAEAVFRAELDFELAQRMAARGPFGLATALQNQLAAYIKQAAEAAAEQQQA